MSYQWAARSRRAARHSSGRAASAGFLFERGDRARWDIVERTAAVAFAEHVRRQIFEPLGMRKPVTFVRINMVGKPAAHNSPSPPSASAVGAKRLRSRSAGAASLLMLAGLAHYEPSRRAPRRRMTQHAYVHQALISPYTSSTIEKSMAWSTVLSRAVFAAPGRSRC